MQSSTSPLDNLVKERYKTLFLDIMTPVTDNPVAAAAELRKLEEKFKSSECVSCRLTDGRHSVFCYFHPDNFDEAKGVLAKLNLKRSILAYVEDTFDAIHSYINVSIVTAVVVERLNKEMKTKQKGYRKTHVTKLKKNTSHRRA